MGSTVRATDADYLSICDRGIYTSIPGSDKQHRVHLLALGGLYQAPGTVKQILAPEFGVDKRILDCGTYSADIFLRFIIVHLTRVSKYRRCWRWELVEYLSLYSLVSALMTRPVRF